MEIDVYVYMCVGIGGDFFLNIGEPARGAADLG